MIDEVVKQRARGRYPQVAALLRQHHDGIGVWSEFGDSIGVLQNIAPGRKLQLQAALHRDCGCFERLPDLLMRDPALEIQRPEAINGQYYAWHDDRCQEDERQPAGCPLERMFTPSGQALPGSK
jgi:hypothetical protein